MFAPYIAWPLKILLINQLTHTDEVLANMEWSDCEKNKL